MSVDLLIERIVTLQNPTVVGLDPNPDAMPPHLLEQAKGDNPFERAAAAVTAFNFALIDALCDIVPAVKPQLACYEQTAPRGRQGLLRDRALRQAARHVCDCRRQARRHRLHLRLLCQRLFGPRRAGGGGAARL